MTSPIDPPFESVPDKVRAQASVRPDHTALIHDDRIVSYADFDRMVDQVAAALQRDGLAARDVIGVCAGTSIEYVALFFGALRAGITVAPLAPSSSAASIEAMLDNAGAARFFVDQQVSAMLEATGGHFGARPLISLDDSAAHRRWSQWLGPFARPDPVSIRPEWAFNLIYSSGTTGAPKGIVQSHGMRAAHVLRALTNSYGPDAVTLSATPLYSNTTLVSVLPTLALGGTLVLMGKFDAAQYLALAERHRVTHAMLVPVQYQRLMDFPDFDRFDLSSFRMKFCTSAPFAAELKAAVLERWPGGLIEYYGMTEGGGRCELHAHRDRDKLHTVGRPGAGCEIRLLDDAGRQAPPGMPGEVVGHSGAMMTGYYGQPEKTAEVEWFDDDGKRFIRTGDIGRFDSDGFLILLDRKKDMIISGGFNIYPSDIEAEFIQHPDVAEVAVVGVPSKRWGETPVAFAVLRRGSTLTAAALASWANARLGKTQRVAQVELLESLPRSHIGKVMKRELRARLPAGL